jgi:hypothetical protein
MTRLRTAYVLSLAAVFACIASSPEASYDGIDVFSDPGGTNCAFYDGGPVLIPVYVFHSSTYGTRGAHFRLNVDNLGWTFLGESSDILRIAGKSIEGITMCYDDCRYGTYHVLTVNFFGSGMAPVCSQVTIDPYPGAGVEAVDCDGNVTYPVAGSGVVNPDVYCFCTICAAGKEAACATKPGPERDSASNFCGAVPVEQTTWGMIKALYK